VDILSKERVVGEPKIGSIHHVAFKAEDKQQQETWQKELQRFGVSPSRIIVGKYFSSLYFNEPGGSLFEISTEGPGFTIDEDLEDLGTTLMLPENLENRRKQIERELPDLEIE